MFEQMWRRDAAREERTLPDSGRSALILAMVILAIIGTAIAVDFTSVPGMAVLTVVVIASLIAALAVWG